MICIDLPHRVLRRNTMDGGKCEVPWGEWLFSKIFDFCCNIAEGQGNKQLRSSALFVGRIGKSHDLQGF